MLVLYLKSYSAGSAVPLLRKLKSASETEAAARDVLLTAAVLSGHGLFSSAERCLAELEHIRTSNSSSNSSGQSSLVDAGLGFHTLLGGAGGGSTGITGSTGEDSFNWFVYLKTRAENALWAGSLPSALYVSTHPFRYL